MRDLGSASGRGRHRPGAPGRIYVTELVPVTRRSFWESLFLPGRRHRPKERSQALLPQPVLVQTPA